MPETGSPSGLIAASPPMKGVLRDIRTYAPSKEPVLVTGESGTGKEGVARSLHWASPRQTARLVALNCGALGSTLIEAELFGYVRGAFTGADQDKAGAFEAADGGSLFLDEIAELPLELQPKLLRALETGSIRPIGSNRERPVDVRVIAATHRDLFDRVADGRFRADLFHRLYVLPIHVPPLRDRREDILALAAHFLEHRAEGARALSDAATRALLDHPWPGNARELRNVLVRASLRAAGETIEAADLELRVPGPEPAEGPPTPDDAHWLGRLLADCGGNQAAAARRLGLSRSTLHDRLRRLGVRPAPARALNRR